MSKYRIMVIDDDDDTRRMLSFILRDRFEVVEAADGLEALSKLETHEPDLAIIDVMMPLMDGYQVCEAIRKHARFNNMQVMFLSAYGTKENIRKGYASGANLFLTKPVEPERVLKNIDFTLRHEPPPLRTKRYTLEQLRELEERQARDGQAVSRTAETSDRRDHGFDVFSEDLPLAGGQPAGAAALMARLLIVDDDVEMLQMLDIALREEFEITTALNGLEAIEHLVEYDPDLMLIDIMMPKMNGYQLLQSVRRNAYFRNLPVIIVSAKSSPRDREYAARLGATGFLAKPFQIDELLETVRPLLAECRIKKKRVALVDIKAKAFKQLRDREERKRDRAGGPAPIQFRPVGPEERDADPPRP